MRCNRHQALFRVRIQTQIHHGWPPSTPPTSRNLDPCFHQTLGTLIQALGTLIQILGTLIQTLGTLIGQVGACVYIRVGLCSRVRRHCHMYMAPYYKVADQSTSALRYYSAHGSSAGRTCISNVSV